MSSTASTMIGVGATLTATITPDAKSGRKSHCRVFHIAGETTGIPAQALLSAVLAVADSAASWIIDCSSLNPAADLVGGDVEVFLELQHATRPDIAAAKPFRVGYNTDGNPYAAAQNALNAVRRDAEHELKVLLKVERGTS